MRRRSRRGGSGSREARRPPCVSVLQLVGVVTMSQDYDEQADFAADPVVLATHGTVPDQWDEFKVAA